MEHIQEISGVLCISCRTYQALGQEMDLSKHVTIFVELERSEVEARYRRKKSARNTHEERAGRNHKNTMKIGVSALMAGGVRRIFQRIGCF